MKRKTLLPRGRRALITILALLLSAFFTWTTHEAVTLPAPLGDAATLYTSETNDDLRHLFVSAINSAKQSVLLVVYTLTDQSVIHALKTKAEEGKHVRVVVDAKASPHAANKLGPLVETVRRLGPGLTHSKLLVIDDEAAWVGSANMTGDSLRRHSNLVFGIKAPLFAKFLTAKGKGLEEIGKAPVLPHQTFQLEKQGLEFWFLPDEGLDALRRIKGLIRGAEKTIRVAMFTWTRMDLANEIARAASRGVNVQVVIDSNSGKGSSARVVSLLKSKNVNVRLSAGKALLHHKMMEVDGKTLVIGSANWTKAAFTANDDCFGILSPLTKEQREKLDEEWVALYADSNAA